jgi:aspartyl-tRNA(Asn)/glutamyl-tRNA(Gln) amidotransferase subunit B
VIGLEVHAEVATLSKMFCGCSADFFGAPPNSHVCPVCLGMPGTLPVINREAVAATIRTALALHCEIPAFAKFDRKNYHYPDLMKGYQISEYDLPLSLNGWVEIQVDGQIRQIGIRRVHLEEDTAKLSHVDGASLVDVNRSGVPLMEIVSEPDMHSTEDIRQYSLQLWQTLRYLGATHYHLLPQHRASKRSLGVSHILCQVRSKTDCRIPRQSSGPGTLQLFWTQE